LRGRVSTKHLSLRAGKIIISPLWPVGATVGTSQTPRRGQRLQATSRDMRRVESARRHVKGGNAKWDVFCAGPGHGAQCDVKCGRPAFPDSDYIQMFIPVDMDEPKLDTDKFKAHLSAPLFLRFNFRKPY